MTFDYRILCTQLQYSNIYSFQSSFPDVEREPCPVPNLLQFHDRYLTYLIAAREREMHQDFRVESWTYEDRRAVIEVNSDPPWRVGYLRFMDDWVLKLTKRPSRPRHFHKIGTSFRNCLFKKTFIAK